MRIRNNIYSWNIYHRVNTQYLCAFYLLEKTSFNCLTISSLRGLPGGAVMKNPPANAGDTGSIPGLGRFPGVGNSSALQYSCLENHMDRGAWWATLRGVAKSGT